MMFGSLGEALKWPSQNGLRTRPALRRRQSGSCTIIECGCASQYLVEADVAVAQVHHELVGQVLSSSPAQMYLPSAVALALPPT